MTYSLTLCILDGWGHAPSSNHNAIDAATTWKRLWQQYPHTLLEASGPAVGLPDCQMGNSEVGHTTIGLGRVIEQDLPRINRLINENAWNLPQTGRCHVMILASKGGVHSHMDHLAKAIEGMPHVDIYLHLLLDGRDTPPQEALSILKELKPHHARLATIGGRYYAMDRDQRWGRVEKAARALLYGEGSRFTHPVDYIEWCYAQGITDEFIEPAVHIDYAGVNKGDTLLFLNFRADRVRQMVHVLHTFQCGDVALTPIHNLNIQGLVDYGYAMTALLPKPVYGESLGEVISKAGLCQYRIAETEKYAHVTFFFNGGVEEPFVGEKRCMVPSPNVATYDLKPEMSAEAVLQATIKAMEDRVPLIVVNFANADMVGHTGSLKATRQAIQAVDCCLEVLEAKALACGSQLLITADHGNAECMIDDLARPHTAHTCNKVPFVWVSQNSPMLKNMGTLADIAPTIIKALHLDVPDAMTGHDLRVEQGLGA